MALDPGPEPAFSVSDLKDANKNICFLSFFCLFFFEGTFASFFKEKRHKEVRKN
jgi:hypothetical protein